MLKEEVNISDLEIKEIGIWPLQFRIVVIGIICIIEVILFYIFFLKDDFNKMSDLKIEQKKLLTDFISSYQKSANLENYKGQMLEIQKMLHGILQKLPSKIEIPGLLEDISQQALNSGLKFELIKPEDPVNKDFYMEQPIQMVLTGKYHDFGKFVEGISKLPRTVTLHNFAISKLRYADNNKDLDVPILLNIKLNAKTYWDISKDQS